MKMNIIRRYGSRESVGGASRAAPPISPLADAADPTTNVSLRLHSLNESQIEVERNE